MLFLNCCDQATFNIISSIAAMVLNTTNKDSLFFKEVANDFSTSSTLK